MNRFIVMAVAVVLLAAGGAARAAEKEAPIDWLARAAMVKVGMTRAEVEKILPKWEPPKSSFQSMFVSAVGAISGGRILRILSWSENYLVEDGWRVTLCYDFNVEETPGNLANSTGNENAATNKRTASRIDPHWRPPWNRLLEPPRVMKIIRSFDEKKEWMAKAASIHAGMTRGEAERNIPAWVAMIPTGPTEVYKYADLWCDRNVTNYTWSLTVVYEGSVFRPDMKDRVTCPAKVETFEKPVLLKKPKPTP